MQVKLFCYAALIGGVVSLGGLFDGDTGHNVVMTAASLPSFLMML